MTTDREQRPALNAKKLVAAALIEFVFLTVGLVAYLRTENVLWLVGAGFLGALGFVWALFAGRGVKGAGSIVEGPKR